MLWISRWAFLIGNAFFWAWQLFWGIKLLAELVDFMSDLFWMFTFAIEIDVPNHAFLQTWFFAPLLKAKFDKYELGYFT